MGGGDIIAVGYRVVGGEARRSITKLALANGAEVWTSTDFGDAAGSNGAWECADFNADESSLVLGGFTGKANLDEMAFKSYGNVFDGNAAALAIPVSALGVGSQPNFVSSSGAIAWR